MQRFDMLLAASAVADTLIFIAALAAIVGLRSRRTPAYFIGVRELVEAVSFSGLVIALKSVSLLAVGLRAFGLLHLLYLDSVVVLPLCAALLLVVGRAANGGPKPIRVRRAAAAVAVLALLAAPVGAYATFVEPNRLAVERTRISLPAANGREGKLRVAVLADLQFRQVGAHEHEAVSAALASQPDVIVLPGDIYQGNPADFEEELPAIRTLLGRLCAPGGVYLVQGDCDSPALLRRMIAGMDVEFLFNDIARAEVAGRTIAVGGVELHYRSDESAETVRRLQTEAASADFALLVAHRPDIVLEMQEPGGIDLVVAGHTHGGQVQVPGIGPLITASRIPRAVAAGGFNRVGGIPLYVSRGVGCERHHAPTVRLFCPPEVSVLDLVRD